MSKFIDKLRSLVKKENPYKDVSIEELEKRKSNLIKQRTYCTESMIAMERGYSRKGFDGASVRSKDDAFYIQLNAVERELNKIEAELNRRNEEKNQVEEPEKF